MNPELINRIVGLVKRQGDPVVVADSATGKAVVIMDLEQYEAMTSGQEAGVPRHPAPSLSPRIEPQVEAPPAPPISHKIEPEKPQKIAKHSENPFKKRAQQLGVESALDPMDLTDLTQTELLDKINRDIGDWKTAQERKRTDELQSVAKRPLRPEPSSVVEAEERFYLEPIE